MATTGSSPRPWSASRKAGLGLARRPPPAEGIADLKARADLAAIVGRQVALRKRGRELWAPLPVPPGREPELQGRCSRADGDTLDFLAAAEGLDRIGAVRR